MNTPPKQREPATRLPGHLSVLRLERLADFVFGAAILMLLLTIDFAPEESGTSADAFDFLWKNVTQTFGFAINFVILAYYWIGHQEYFSYYKRTNKLHTFIELLFLLTIVAMPFNNQFLLAFPMDLAPRIGLSSDIFVAGMLSFFSWSYATSGARLVDPGELTPDRVRYMRLQALVLPGCAIVAVGAAFIHPLVWDVILFVGPIGAMILLRKPKD